MERNVRDALERVERAVAKSKQPRFGKPVDSSAFFTNVIKWVNRASTEEPPYKADSRTRDKWLADFWKTEPHLAGIMSSVNAIDSNRGWHLTGGRNQVNRFVNMFRFADGGSGWRQYISQQSTAYYSSDLGSLTETARDGRGGPLREIYHLDPTKCMLTGNYDRPLRYDKTKKDWSEDDFFRLTSMKNIQEDFHGLGFCAVSRCLEMSKLMLAVYGQHSEELGAKAPRGLLLLQNIGQDQWQEAMKTRDAALDSDMRKYYNAVAVIAQQGFESIDAKLIALSNLPNGFDLEVFTNLLMYAYALCFNYDPIEFWPVTAGQLGRGRETDIQHRKGTGKGGLNFMLAFQDQMAMQLPSTLLFEFEQRDQEGVLLDAAVAQAWANVVATLTTGGSSAAPGPAGPKGGDGEPAQPSGNKDDQSEDNPQDQRPASAIISQAQGIISIAEARQMLAMQGVIPARWTEEEEDVTATDARNPEEERERLLSNESIRRAIYEFPEEPIIRYSWPNNRAEILFNRSQDILARTRFTLLKPAALISDSEYEEIEEVEESVEEGDWAEIEQSLLEDGATIEIPQEDVTTIPSYSLEDVMNETRGEVDATLDSGEAHQPSD